MSPEPITIYFETGVRFVPVEGRHFDGDFAADLFHELRKPGGHSYKNLDTDPNCSLSTEEMTAMGSTWKRCDIDPYDINVMERRRGSTVDDFASSVRDVLAALEEIRPDAPPIFCQRTCIEIICKTTACPDSLMLLAGVMSHVLGHVKPFERPPSYFGVRFRFAPADREDLDSIGTFSGNTEREDFLTLRFETYSDDRSFVWMEAESIRLFQEEPKFASDSEDLEAHIKDTHEFLTKNGVEFLEQFDIELEEGDEDEPDED